MFRSRFLKQGVGFLLAGSFLFFISNGLPVGAQTEEERMVELRKQIENLEKEAQQYRTQIAQQQATGKSLKGEIAGLESQIKRIQTQISLTEAKISRTNLEIGGITGSISETEGKIEDRKDTIAKMLLYLSRRDHEPLLAVLLKNGEISDFLNQAQYAANINTSLLDLVAELKNEKNQLESQKEDLESKSMELESLKGQQQYERVSLGEVKTGKNQLLKVTKGQESQYAKMLKDVEAKKALFFNELRELETKVIQGGLYLVHVKADTVPPKGTKIFQWPEDDYYLTQGYGMTSYAKRGAYGGAGHNGIDISSGLGTPIKAIGDGEIIANGSNSGWGNWVAIKHPNNLVSVYGHMSSLSFLRVGTAVKVGEVIGYEGSTGNSTGSHLHLSLYREFFTYINEAKKQLYFNYFDGSLNPADYLP